MKRKVYTFLLVFLSVLLVVGLTVRLTNFHNVNAPTVEATPEPTMESTPVPTPEVYEATMFVTGDGLLHGAVYKDAYQPDGTYDFTGMLRRIAPICSKYDLQYYNQESILGGNELGFFSYPTFNSPHEFGDAMVDMGFNLVSTANNHSLDMGEKGIINSVNYWRNQEGVLMAGTNLSFEEQEEIPVREINGITYTLLSYTYGTNGLVTPEGKEYLVNLYPGHEEEMLEKVRKADQMVDVVIMAMHWGTEYSMDVNEEQHTLARQLVEAGADIIVGNHPHVIEPVEWIGDRICFYAMGNFISAQDQLARLIGMIAGLKITKTVDQGETTISISDVRTDLIYTYYYNHGNFDLIPFNELDDSILPNHESIYAQFCEVIHKIDPTITIGGV